MANLMTDTPRTYATYQNAEAALRRAAGDIDLEDLRYVITVTPEGRFAPAVLLFQRTLEQYQTIAFVRRGVSVIG